LLSALYSVASGGRLCNVKATATVSAPCSFLLLSSSWQLRLLRRSHDRLNNSENKRKTMRLSLRQRRLGTLRKPRSEANTQTPQLRWIGWGDLYRSGELSRSGAAAQEGTGDSPNHPHVAVSLSDLAVLYFKRGRVRSRQSRWPRERWQSTKTSVQFFLSARITRRRGGPR
jgi:hypothetical protein